MILDLVCDLEILVKVIADIAKARSQYTSCFYDANHVVVGQMNVEKYQLPLSITDIIGKANFGPE